MEIQPDQEKLRLYSEAKLKLADRLRVMREAFKAMGHYSLEQQCGDLMVKLAEDRFTLAVLGQFKRGKSSLMNAILGRKLLPTGVLPLTSAITILTYGPKERLVIERYNSAFKEEHPIASLPDFVTEDGNPANHKKIKTARVEFPLPFLRRGIEFVDTPGIGSSIAANTVTTYNYLPECNAVLFVTSMETPMTSLELEFLRDIRTFVKKIFFVVNKADLLGEEERGSVVEFMAGTIRKESWSETLKIFPVSALSGLKAQLNSNPELYCQSGIGILEDALTSFLSEEKMNTFLSAIAQKAIRMLDGEEILGKLRTDLMHLYDDIQIGSFSEKQGMEESFVFSTEHEDMETSVISPTKFKVPDFNSDLNIRGCPVCRHMTECAADFFIYWQNKIATDEKAQEYFATEHGFCPMHTWQLMAVTSPQGASLGFPKLAGYLARILNKGSTNNIDGLWIQELIPDSGTCRVCNTLKEVEDKYILKLTEFIADGTGLEQYLGSQGVCLHHLEKLVAVILPGSTREIVIRHAGKRLDETAEDMRNYSLKRDALRRSLLNSSEEDAYMRAVVHIFGDRMVCMPWPRDRYI